LARLFEVAVEIAELALGDEAGADGAGDVNGADVVGQVDAVDQFDFFRCAATIMDGDGEGGVLSLSRGPGPSTHAAEEVEAASGLIDGEVH
jgi:hypothetical protein